MLITCFSAANLSMLKPSYSFFFSNDFLPFQSVIQFSNSNRTKECRGRKNGSRRAEAVTFTFGFKLREIQFETNCARSAIVTPFTVTALAGSVLSARAAMHSRRQRAGRRSLTKKVRVLPLRWRISVPLLIPHSGAGRFNRTQCTRAAFLHCGASVLRFFLIEPLDCNIHVAGTAKEKRN